MKTIAQQLKITKFPFIINDDNGNELYYEDSDGAWNRCEFNDNGNELYYETSDGYWNRFEYDDDGSVTYREDSNGSIVVTKRTLPLISSQNALGQPPATGGEADTHHQPLK